GLRIQGQSQGSRALDLHFAVARHPGLLRLGLEVSIMTHDPGEELVDVIDDGGRTIRIVTRREVRQHRLPHRCVYVLVFNRKGELFIHLRTSTKDVYPSHWDVCVGGVLAAGESFDAGARREIAEELGLNLDPERLFLFRYADSSSIVQG